MRTLLTTLAVSIPFVFWRDWLLYMLAVGYGLSALFGAAADATSSLHRANRWMLRSLGLLLTVYMWAMVVLADFALLIGIGTHAGLALVLVAGPVLIAILTARATPADIDGARTAASVKRRENRDSGEAAGDRGQQPDLPSERA